MLEFQPPPFFYIWGRFSIPNKRSISDPISPSHPHFALQNAPNLTFFWESHFRPSANRAKTGPQRAPTPLFPPSSLQNDPNTAPNVTQVPATPRLCLGGANSHAGLGQPTACHRSPSPNPRPETPNPTNPPVSCLLSTSPSPFASSRLCERFHPLPSPRSRPPFPKPVFCLLPAVYFPPIPLARLTQKPLERTTSRGYNDMEHRCTSWTCQGVRKQQGGDWG